MAQILRWVAVPLAGVVGWLATLFVGMASIGLLDSLCPPELVVSGACTAPWYDPAFTTLAVAFSFVVAFPIVLAPAATAPTHRFAVAIVAFLCGAAFATYVVAVDYSLWPHFLAAGLGGSISIVLASSRWRQSGVAA